jgi:flagellar hook assembly protein FlgD
VALLVDEWRAAGRHTVSWNGLHASGGKAQAGIYVARLEANGDEVTTRITRLD